MDKIKYLSDERSELDLFFRWLTNQQLQEYKNARNDKM